MDRQISCATAAAVAAIVLRDVMGFSLSTMRSVSVWGRACGRVSWDSREAAKSAMQPVIERTWILVPLSISETSFDLDQVLVWQWPARKLSKLAADRERSKVDAGEADPFDERRYFGFRRVVIA